MWLDLSALTYCDAAGLATFVALHHYVSAFDSEVVLYQPREIVSRVLAITGVDKVIRVIGPPSLSTQSR